MNDFTEKQKAIEEFLMDIEVLEKLEVKVSNFNAFETLGVVNTEIRHSNVLAWLLTPTENHGLGETFIKKFIQTICYQNRGSVNDSNINLVKLSIMDYHDFIVRREWRNIDLLAISEENKLLLVIENKVWSKESEHQLKKYLDIVNGEFEDYSKIFIFLTPYGDSPSDEENWISFDYKNVFDILQKSIELRKESISLSVKLFLDQYSEILRRHIVGDKELEKICREIYYKHQKALDLIFEYKPDMYSEISYYINELLDEKPYIIKDISNKTYTRFTTENLNSIIENKGRGWTSTNRIMLYEIQNKNDKMVLKIILGPGDAEIRGKIYEIANNNKNLFKGMSSSLSQQYTTILSKDILPKNYIDKYDMDTIQKRIKDELERFFNIELREIDECVKKNYR